MPKRQPKAKGTPVPNPFVQMGLGGCTITFSECGVGKPGLRICTEHTKREVKPNTVTFLVEKKDSVNPSVPWQ